jgi:predicted patatin/cPLA2 family phospholipase
MVRTGLVLEGGGLRAVYNSGFLDRMDELGVSFDYIVGSSAGAINAGSFLSHQKGRTKRIVINYLTAPRFFSVRNVLAGRSYMDLEYLFGDVTFTLDPLDLDALLENPTSFEITGTDLETGEAVYLSSKKKDIITILMASAAIPFAGQKPIKYKKHLLFDGGIADPIPVKRAVKKKCDKIVVVLTQPRDFIKKPSTSSVLFMKMRYGKHKGFIKTIKKRHNVYNITREYIDKPPEGVKLFPIYPSKKHGVDRLTRDKEAIKRVWELGYNDTKNCEKKLMKFLGE